MMMPRRSFSTLRIGETLLTEIQRAREATSWNSLCHAYYRTSSSLLLLVVELDSLPLFSSPPMFDGSSSRCDPSSSIRLVDVCNDSTTSSRRRGRSPYLSLRMLGSFFLRSPSSHAPGFAISNSLFSRCQVAVASISLLRRLRLFLGRVLVSARTIFFSFPNVVDATRPFSAPSLSH